LTLAGITEMQKRCPKCNQTAEVSSVLPVDTLCPKCGARIPYENPTTNEWTPAQSPSKQVTQSVRAERPKDLPKPGASTGVRTSKSSPQLPAVPKLEDLGNDAPLESRVRLQSPPAAKSGKSWLLLVAGLVIGLILAGSCAGVALLFFGIRSNTNSQVSSTVSDTIAHEDTIDQPPPTPRPPEEKPKPPDDPPPPSAPTGMRLPAAPVLPAIEPTAMPEPRFALQCDDIVQRILLAGGGQYLAVQLQKSQRIALVSVASKSIVATLPFENGAHFAATLQHLFVYSPKRQMLERFRLPDLAREIGRPAIPPSAMTSLCAGGESNGPVLLATDRGADFIDTDTLTPIPSVFVNASTKLPGGRWWAAANGRTFGNLNAADASVWRFENDKLRRIGLAAKSSEFVAFNQDASMVFNGSGIAVLPPINSSIDQVSILPSSIAPIVLPAQAGNLLVAVIDPNRGPGGPAPMGPGGFGPMGPGGFPPGMKGPGGPMPPFGPGGPMPGGKGPRPGGGGPGTPVVTQFGDGSAIVGVGTQASGNYLMAGIDAEPSYSGTPSIEDAFPFDPRSTLAHHALNQSLPRQFLQNRSSLRRHNRSAQSTAILAGHAADRISGQAMVLFDSGARWNRRTQRPVRAFHCTGWNDDRRQRHPSMERAGRFRRRRSLVHGDRS